MCVCVGGGCGCVCVYMCVRGTQCGICGYTKITGQEQKEQRLIIRAKGEHCHLLVQFPKHVLKA